MLPQEYDADSAGSGVSVGAAVGSAVTSPDGATASVPASCDSAPPFAAVLLSVFFDSVFLLSAVTVDSFLLPTVPSPIMCVRMNTAIPTAARARITPITIINISPRDLLSLPRPG